MFRLLAIAAICTVLIVPIAGFSSHIISNGPILIAVSFGLAYVLAPIYLLHVWPAQKANRLKTMGEALEAGELETTEYEVSAAVEIEEVEDEGLHFLLTIEGGRTLFLSGQYLYGPVERKDFPAKRIRVFKNKTDGRQYGIEPAGGQFPEWPVYSFAGASQEPTDFDIEDGHVYATPVSDLIEKAGLRLRTA